MSSACLLVLYLGYCHPHHLPTKQNKTKILHRCLHSSPGTLQYYFSTLSLRNYLISDYLMCYTLCTQLTNGTVSPWSCLPEYRWYAANKFASYSISLHLLLLSVYPNLQRLLKSLTDHCAFGLKQHQRLMLFMELLDVFPQTPAAPERWLIRPGCSPSCLMCQSSHSPLAFTADLSSIFPSGSCQVMVF